MSEQQQCTNGELVASRRWLRMAANQAHGGTVAGEDSRMNRPMAGRTCGPVPAEFCKNLFCRGRHGSTHVVLSHRPSRLVQAGLLAFRQELSRPLRRAHFLAMFKDERVDMLAAHHAAPTYLADLANLLRNHEPSATKASITGDLCSVRDHISSPFRLKVILIALPHLSAARQKGFRIRVPAAACLARLSTASPRH